MTETIPLIVGYPIIALCAIGGVVLIIIGIRKKENVRNIDNKALLADIKSALININAYERELATKKAGQVYSRKIAKQVYNDFTTIHGDGLTLIKNLVHNVVEKRDFDYLINYLQKNADILDMNDCGLKRELSENESYKDLYTNLAQKRARLKLKEEKRAIIQKNINRVCSLTYGINSYIVFRGISKSLPDEFKQILLSMFVIMESAETQMRTVLTKMLDNIDIEWKVTVNFDGM